MNIRKYRVKSMAEGLARIKLELGDDAVILSTTKLHNDPEGATLEISVAPADDAIASVPSTRRIEGPRPEARLNAQSEPAPQPGVGDLMKEIGALRSEIRQMRLDRELRPPLAAAPAAKPRRQRPAYTDAIRAGVRLNRLSRVRSEVEFAREFSALYDSLLKAGVLESHLDELMADLMSAKTDEAMNIGRELERLVERRVETTEALWHQRTQLPQLAVFVGPSGVGKTTAVAKVAGQALFSAQRRVGIICTDVFKVGGVYQLETYADLYEVPFRVASDIREVRAALVDL
ncbi:MAG: hypothetical protein KC561_13765, partial [Myxococcales bacterium]|nr:hypothetical protein [Myxococcales bacterium]